MLLKHTEWQFEQQPPRSPSGDRLVANNVKGICHYRVVEPSVGGLQAIDDFGQCLYFVYLLDNLTTHEKAATCKHRQGEQVA